MILSHRRRDAQTRAQATAIARQLALDLYNDTPAGPAPYSVGIVLQCGEIVWAQILARCSDDRPATPRESQPSETDWLVTNLRVAGRVRGDMLRWWEWAHCIGCQVDLTPGCERISLDFPGLDGPVRWSGPGVAPLAVAAVVKLHGPRAALDHPGLAPLRSSTPAPRTTAADHGLRPHLAGELTPSPDPIRF